MPESAKVLGIRKWAEEQRAIGAEIEHVLDAEVVTLDEAAAKRLDTSLRLTVGTIRSNFDKLQDKVHQAKYGEAWKVLGFPSWTAYLADIFGGQPLLVFKEDRPELVSMLHDEGLSNRAVAQALHVSEGTVRNDLRSIQTHEAERRAEHRKERDAQSAEEGAQNYAPAAKRTTGLDGKTYTRPTPVPDPPKVKPAPKRAAKAPKAVPHAKILRNLGVSSIAPLAKVLEEITDFDESVTDDVREELFAVYAELSSQTTRVARLLCPPAAQGRRP